jgi:segregation and condensation protein B
MSDTASPPALKHIIEALLLAAGGPLSANQLVSLFAADEAYSMEDVSKAWRTGLTWKGAALNWLKSLPDTAQTWPSLLPWISRLWEERLTLPRALLETWRSPIGIITAAR